MTVLQVKSLCVKDVVHDVAFSIAPGERVGLIGESGSGKTLTAMSVMRLIRSSGEIRLGEDRLDLLSERDLCTIRGKRVAMIFQEPMTALNPLMKVGKQVAEAVLTHLRVTKRQAMARAVELLGKVELPADMANRYPHQLSGGQRQRVLIAMALAHDPELLICDEPTTALDVTSQRAIVELILKLVAERGTGLLFITHDLGLVAQTCERVLVMKDGRVVEEAPVDKLLTAPEQPYTRSLIDASTLPDPRPANRSDEVVITATNLTKKFKSTTAVDDISFTVVQDSLE